MDVSTPESVFGIDASACCDLTASLPFVRVGKTMGQTLTAPEPTAAVSQTMDRSLSTPEISSQVWRVSSKPTIRDNQPEVDVLSGDNQVEVGIRPELDNIRVNLCSCLVSVECCSHGFGRGRV